MSQCITLFSYFIYLPTKGFPTSQESKYIYIHMQNHQNTSSQEEIYNLKILMETTVPIAF